MILPALALVTAATATEPIDTALGNLFAVVEDDENPDARLTALRTEGCTTRVVAEGREWTIDWRKAEAIGREDVFLHVAAPPTKLAIVADLKNEADSARLTALVRAMEAKANACGAKPPS